MINISKLLKDAPKGMKLYSPLFGEVTFLAVDSADLTIVVETERETHEWFSAYGKYKVMKSHLLYSSAECLLFPSKEIRTWENFKLPVEPKFRVGDSLQSGSMWAMVRRIDTENQRYICQFDNVIPFEEQDQWHLAHKPHYDIKNFKPFDKVLTRDTEYGNWNVNLFSYYIDDEDARVIARFRCMNSLWAQCIPFNEKTKHLLGTTDMPSEEYINW